MSSFNGSSFNTSISSASSGEHAHSSCSQLPSVSLLSSLPSVLNAAISSSSSLLSSLPSVLNAAISSSSSDMMTSNCSFSVSRSLASPSLSPSESLERQYFEELRESSSSSLSSSSPLRQRHSMPSSSPSLLPSPSPSIFPSPSLKTSNCILFGLFLREVSGERRRCVLHPGASE